MWLKTGVPTGKYLDVPGRSEGYHVREASYLASIPNVIKVGVKGVTRPTAHLRTLGR